MLLRFTIFDTFDDHPALPKNELGAGSSKQLPLGLLCAYRIRALHESKGKVLMLPKHWLRYSLLLCCAIQSFVTADEPELLKDVQWQCQFDGSVTEEDVYLFASDKEAQEVVARIVKYAGLEQNFEVQAASVPNAQAVVRGEKRLLLYNQEFMRRVKDATKTDWAAVSIMAHEIGHHLQGHTLKPGGSRPPIELEADKFSGHILYRMGATLEEAQAAMKEVANERASETHPAKSARLAAIVNGWIQASDQDVERQGRSTTRPSPTTRRSEPDANSQAEKARRANRYKERGYVLFFNSDLFILEAGRGEMYGSIMMGAYQPGIHDEQDSDGQYLIVQVQSADGRFVGSEQFEIEKRGEHMEVVDLWGNRWRMVKNGDWRPVDR